MNETDLSIQRLEEDVSKLKLLIENHIGDGGEAHAISSDGLAGFVEKQTLSFLAGERVRLENNLDILKLPVGKWELVTNVNTPSGDGGFWEVDVTRSIEDPLRRQLMAVRSGTRRIHYRNYHTNGEVIDAPDFWGRIPQEYTLWEGKEGKMQYLN